MLESYNIKSNNYHEMSIDWFYIFYHPFLEILTNIDIDFAPFSHSVIAPKVNNSQKERKFFFLKPLEFFFLKIKRI